VEVFSCAKCGKKLRWNPLLKEIFPNSFQNAPNSYGKNNFPHSLSNSRGKSPRIIRGNPFLANLCPNSAQIRNPSLLSQEMPERK